MQERTCDGSCWATFAGRDHDQKLHNTVIDLAAATLDNIDILIPNRHIDIHPGLSIAEFSQVGFGGRSS